MAGSAIPRSECFPSDNYPEYSSKADASQKHDLGTLSLAALSARLRLGVRAARSRLRDMCLSFSRRFFCNVCFDCVFLAVHSFLYRCSWAYTSTLAYIVDANNGRSSTVVATNSAFRGVYFCRACCAASILTVLFEVSRRVFL